MAWLRHDHCDTHTVHCIWRSALSPVCRSYLHGPAYMFPRIRYGSVSIHCSAFHSSTKLTKFSTASNTSLWAVNSLLQVKTIKTDGFSQPVKICNNFATTEVVVVSTLVASGLKLTAHCPSPKTFQPSLNRCSLILECACRRLRLCIRCCEISTGRLLWLGLIWVFTTWSTFPLRTSHVAPILLQESSLLSVTRHMLSSISYLAFGSLQINR